MKAITFITFLALTGCSGCVTLHENKPEVVETEVLNEALKCAPPKDMFGAVPMDCDELDEAMCCIYGAKIEFPDGGGWKCRYFLCRNSCPGEWGIIHGECMGLRENKELPNERKKESI